MRVFLLLAVFFLSSCGGGGGSNNTNTSNPLIGSWEYTYTDSDCKEIYTFFDDNTFTIESNNEIVSGAYNLLSDDSIFLFGLLDNSQPDCEGNIEDHTDSSHELGIAIDNKTLSLSDTQSSNPSYMRLYKVRNASQIYDIQKYIYVDTSGECGGNIPCFSSISAALYSSLLLQFDSGFRNRRPNAPADQIIVFPGVHKSDDPTKEVVNIGIGNAYSPNGRWKIELRSRDSASSTIITGFDVGPCFSISDNVEVSIRGFTIKNCYEHLQSIINEDYAIYINSYTNASITIEDNVFEENASEEAAIGIDPYSAILSNLNINISRNLFKYNTGAIYLDSISSQRGTESAFVQIDNNVIHGNEYGILIHNFESTADDVSLSILNNTIVSNLYFGLNLTNTYGVLTKNNIVYNNPIDIREGYDPITSNLVGETNYISNIDENIVGDPLLEDLTFGDYSPSGNSIAIDAGTDYGIGSSDIDFLGNNRLINHNSGPVALPDMGAIELQN